MRWTSPESETGDGDRRTLGCRTRGNLSEASPLVLDVSNMYYYRSETGQLSGYWWPGSTWTQRPGNGATLLTCTQLHYADMNADASPSIFSRPLSLAPPLATMNTSHQA